MLSHVMQTATVRVLRNDFARVSQAIERGESVRITKSGKAFAVLQPLRRTRKNALKWPDFAARLEGGEARQILGPVDGSLEI